MPCHPILAGGTQQAQGRSVAAVSIGPIAFLSLVLFQVKSSHLNSPGVTIHPPAPGARASGCLLPSCQLGLNQGNVETVDPKLIKFNTWGSK